jgi:DNA repair exonuclease SbcCD nuclease subunit
MQRACREAFEQLVDFAIDQGVAFVILAGDHDHDAPNMQIAMFLRSQLSRLDKKGIRAVIVKGNHDAENRITSALALPPNTHIFSDRRAETIRYDDLPTRIALHGQSFKAGPISDNLALNYPPAVSGYLNIGVLHTSLAGSTEHDPYAPCKLEDLAIRGYDYWALGHIHKGAILARTPWIVYPGNLQGRHAKETGPKGCMLVTVEDDRINSVESIDLDVVRWQQTHVDLDGAATEADLIEQARSALAQAYRDANGRPTAVRVVLRGATALFDVIEAKPKRTLQTFLELASEVGGDDIWIEKIQNGTWLPNISHTLAPGDGDILRIIEEIASDPSRIEAQLRKELGPLNAKLPEELKHVSAVDDLNGDGAIAESINRLKPRLTALLSGEGDV